jgi:hypothetical protein
MLFNCYWVSIFSFSYSHRFVTVFCTCCNFVCVLPGHLQNQDLFQHVCISRHLVKDIPGVYSAPNRNEYQKHKNNNVSGE